MCTSLGMSEQASVKVTLIEEGESLKRSIQASKTEMYLGPDKKFAHRNGSLEDAFSHRAKVVLGVAFELEHVDASLNLLRQ